jgi:non-ribosomal peptide synthetase component F
MDNDFLPNGIGAEDWVQIQIWNSRCPTAANECLHDLIHRRAILQPDSIALCAWDGQMTYGHFDHVTTQVACFLAQRGVLPGGSVPICFEKSKWAIVSMIAILKVGAAFVPLDPSQPGERLKAIINDLGAKYVATSTCMAHIAENLGVDVLIIDQPLVDNLSLERTVILPPITSSATAFIMFTVCSTWYQRDITNKYSVWKHWKAECSRHTA